MMCGIDEAIRHIQEECPQVWAQLVINRLDYHRKQAIGERPKYHKGMSIKDYYTCGNCGRNIEIIFDYCPKCGYAIKWNTTRCLTGLPLVDASEKEIRKDV